MPQFHEIIFLREAKRVNVAEGTTLLQAAREAGMGLEAPCDGRGTCGKCRIQASGAMSQLAPAEIRQFSGLPAHDLRLACQAKVYGPVTVTTPEDYSGHFMALEGGYGHNWPLNPSVTKQVFRSPSGQKPLAEGVVPAFSGALVKHLQQLAAAGHSSDTCWEVIFKNDRVLDIRGQRGRPCLGLSLDIGTTSVVLELFNLETGESIGVTSCLNPQAEFGGDVLTRISFAVKQADGTLILQKKVVDGINRLIQELTTTYNLSSDDIYEVVIAGNTTMLHLLLGVHPGSLAYAPYRPVFLQGMELPPAAVGLKVSPYGNVTLLPSAAAFVGADIIAGILATGLHSYTGTALFIDIGTNGEIVVCKDGVLVGTSAAAGPALEGMNIACGCRAQNGAIESVVIEDDGALRIRTIGRCAPAGICGSGLIELVSELVRVGVIRKNGRFAESEALKPSLAARMVKMGGQPAFMISREAGIYLSQKDVRQVQLAKGALVAATELLLRELNMEPGAVAKVLVAGAFGFHLQPAALIGMGLLPPIFREKICFVGNTAKTGANAVLLNRQAARVVPEIGSRLTIRELSLQEDFQEYFVRALAFPTV